MTMSYSGEIFMNGVVENFSNLMSIHVVIPVSVGTAFLIIQLCCVISFKNWLKGQQKELEKLKDNNIVNHDANPATYKVGWISWVQRHFPVGISDIDEISRTDAIQELDWFISSNKSLSWLHRLGIIAPVVGVIITSIGFLGIEFPNFGNSESIDFLIIIRPVFFGIIVGAGLSISNQICLQVSEISSDKFCESAKAWLDEKILPNVEKKEDVSYRESTEVLNQIAAEFKSFMKTKAVQNEIARESAKTVERAADIIKLAVGSVTTEWKSSVKIMNSSGKELTNAINKLQALLPDGNAITDKIEVAIDNFSRTIETNFSEKIGLQERAALGLSNSVETINGVIQSVSDAAKIMVVHNENQQKTTEEFLRVFQEEVLPGQKLFTSLGKDLGNNVNNLNKQINKLANLSGESLVEIAALLPEITRVVKFADESVGAFRAVVDMDLSLASSKICELSDEWSEAKLRSDELMNQVKNSTALLDNSNAVLSDILTRLANSTSGIENAIDGFQQSMELSGKKFYGISTQTSEYVDNLSKPIEQFQNLMSEKLSNTLDNHLNATEVITSNLSDFVKSLSVLIAGAEEYSSLINRQNLFIPEFEKTITDSVIKIHDELNSLSNTVSSSKTVLTHFYTHLGEVVNYDINHSNQSVSIASFQDQIERAINQIDMIANNLIELKSSVITNNSSKSIFGRFLQT